MRISSSSSALGARVCGTESGIGGSCQVIAGITNRGNAFDNFNGNFGIDRDSYWPRSLAAMTVTGLILLILSVQLVSPTRRWRLRLPRPRQRPAGGEA